MIFTELIGPNILKIRISGLAHDNDFVKLIPQVNRLLDAHGSLALLLDATAFDGWSDMQAAKKHFAFVRDHQMKIGRIALIVGCAWQQWIAGAVSAFAHPEIKIFTKTSLGQASTWLRQ